MEIKAASISYTAQTVGKTEESAQRIDPGNVPTDGSDRRARRA